MFCCRTTLVANLRAFRCTMSRPQKHWRTKNSKIWGMLVLWIKTRPREEGCESVKRSILCNDSLGDHLVTMGSVEDPFSINILRGSCGKNRIRDACSTLDITDRQLLCLYEDWLSAELLRHFDRRRTGCRWLVNTWRREGGGNETRWSRNKHLSILWLDKNTKPPKRPALW